MARFRVQAIKVFLTYAQCHLTKEYVLEQLTLPTNSWTVDDYAIGLEQHQDGNPHLHVYLKFVDKIDCRNERAFDICDFHPNIQVPRSAKAVIHYVIKGGDYLISDGIKVTIEKKSWGEILHESDTKEEYLALVQKHYPRDHAVNYERLVLYANAMFPETIVPYNSPDLTWILPEVLQLWVADNLRADPKPYRPRSLILYGPTRLGKTLWARSLGQHCYFNGMFNLDDYNSAATYAVFDDIEWKYFPNKKQFLGGQQTFTVTDKYRKKRTITWGIPTIYLMNEDNYVLLDQDPMKPWLRDNCLHLYVNRKLFV